MTWKSQEFQVDTGQYWLFSLQADQLQSSILAITHMLKISDQLETHKPENLLLFLLTFLSVND